MPYFADGNLRHSLVQQVCEKLMSCIIILQIYLIFNLSASSPAPICSVEAKEEGSQQRFMSHYFWYANPNVLRLFGNRKKKSLPWVVSICYGQEATHWQVTQGSGQCLNAYWGLSVSIEIFVNIYFWKAGAVVAAFARVEIRNVAGNKRSVDKSRMAVSDLNS